MCPWRDCVYWSACMCTCSGRNGDLIHWERAPFREMLRTSIHADITSFISTHWLYLLHLLLGSPPRQLLHGPLSSPITFLLSLIPSFTPFAPFTPFNRQFSFFWSNLMKTFSLPHKKERNTKYFQATNDFAVLSWLEWVRIYGGRNVKYLLLGL